MLPIISIRIFLLKGELRREEKMSIQYNLIVYLSGAETIGSKLYSVSSKSFHHAMVTTSQMHILFEDDNKDKRMINWI